MTPRHHDPRPGGKHDNDLADFRRIALIPTVEEVMAPVKDEYLPPDRQANRFLSDNQSHILDSQFRLLRADLVRPLREKLTEVSKSTAETQLHNVRFTNACVSFKKRAHVLVHFKPPRKITDLSLKKRTTFWSESKLLTTTRWSALSKTDSRCSLAASHGVTRTASQKTVKSE